MYIAVLSDTHLSVPTPWFRTLYAQHLAPTDAVLHCGDLDGLEILFFLEQHPIFYGVAGNRDHYSIGERLPYIRTIHMAGLTIGLIHGNGLGPTANVAASFGDGYDLICYGHTHHFEWTRKGTTAVLNPGSARLSRHGAPSMALLEITVNGTMIISRLDLDIYPQR
ncbi:Phosphoesterase [Desulfovibrionales bacterium]